MSFWRKLFGEDQSIEQALEESITQSFALESGCSYAEAKSNARAVIQKSKDDARKGGTFPPNAGDIFLERERTDAKTRSELQKKRLEGVTDDDIRWYWNRNDLERRVEENMHQSIMYARFWQFVEDEGRTPEEAAVLVRKFFPYYGDPNDTRITTGDDRPLPVELMRREDDWFSKQRTQDPVAFQKRLKEFSSFNALMRAEIRMRRL